MSITKDITSNISQNILRDIISSDETTFSPLDFDPLLYFDGEDLNSLPSVNPVENIFDVSSNSNDLQQTIANNKPALDTFEGFRCINADGLDDYIGRNDALGLTGNAEITAFFVIAYDTIVPTDLEFFCGFGTSGNQVRVNIGKNANNNRMLTGYGGTNLQFDIAITTGIQLITYIHPSENHNSTRMRRNGVEATRVTSNTSSLNLSDNAFNLLTRVNPSSTAGQQYFEGLMFSCGFYNKLFSTEELEQIEGFFIDKYSI